MAKRGGRHKKIRGKKIRQRFETRRRGDESARGDLERHESDGALSGARGAARHPDQPDAARGLGTRLRRDAAPDLGVGEHAAADREPARAPPLADVGPLVQDPRHRRRRPRVLRRRGAVAGREPAARGRPLTGEAAERVHLPRPHRGRPLVSLSLYIPRTLHSRGHHHLAGSSDYSIRAAGSLRLGWRLASGARRRDVDSRAEESG
jgi:hypothetical protein